MDYRSGRLHTTRAIVERSSLPTEDAPGAAQVPGLPHNHRGASEAMPGLCGEESPGDEKQVQARRVPEGEGEAMKWNDVKVHPPMREIYKGSPLTSGRLLVFAVSYITVGSFQQSYIWKNDAGCIIPVTHWAPLPDPPEAGK
jgi:hypothetical protein